MGARRRARVPREVPGPPDADARGGRAAERDAWRELRDHGVPLQQARPRGVLSDGSRRARDGRQRDVLFDRHLLSPAHARDLSGARLSPVPGRGRHVDGRRRDEGEGPAGRGSCARRAAGRLSHLLPGETPFIGGDSPSIADIRLSATLEFLDAIDYDLPDWAREYMAAMEAALGDAYSEPAADVRGYIASVKP